MHYLKSKYLTIILILITLVTYGYSEVDLKPLHAGLAQEYGQMKNLVFVEDGAFTDGYTINRTIGWFVQQATIDDRFDVTMALGGLFFHFFPYNHQWDATKVRVSAVSIAQASATYKFGEVETPSFQISFGIMPYKYNSNSRNLGEYLFRSTPYPNTSINGSWDIINSSYSKVKGFLFEKDIAEGMWKNDLLLTISDETYPLHDLSLAYISDFKFGPIELGLGVNFYKLIPNKPSLASPKKQSNSYFTHTNGVTYIGSRKYYLNVGAYYGEEAKRLLDTDPQKALLLAQETQFDSIANFVDSINRADTIGALIRPNRNYYTYKGNLLMGKFSIDLGSLISEAMDFKIYGEIDVLGWTNHPILYEDRSQRTPLMLGVSIPTMGVLDFLSFEMEHWKNPYPIVYYSAKIDGTPTIDDQFLSPKYDLTTAYTDDDFKWSIAAQKTVGEYFSINAQIANDHTRPIFADFSPYLYETLLGKDSWYYLLRVQINL